MNSILLIGQLLETVGAVDGRKKFQKLVHILQHFGVPFHFKFGYLHYGPYSSELDGQLQSFESDGLIKEEEFQAGAFKGFRFTADPSLTTLVSLLAKGQEMPLADLAKQLNGKTAQELEALSTIYFLEASGKTGDELKDAFKALKPKFESVFEQRLATAQELRKQYTSIAA